VNLISFTIIVPVCNERDLVESSIDLIYRYASSSLGQFEIIVVESGSTDGTGYILDQIVKKYPHMRIIHEGARNGFGSAISVGISAARYDYIWVITLDLPFPLCTMDAVAAILPDYDCILSYRSSDNRGVYRRFQSLVFNFLTKKILRLHVKQINSAFKVYRRISVQSHTFKSKGWLFDAELIFLLNKKNLKYCEIPVPLVERSVGKSSVKLLDIFLVLKELLNLIKIKS